MHLHVQDFYLCALVFSCYSNFCFLLASSLLQASFYFHYRYISVVLLLLMPLWSRYHQRLHVICSFMSDCLSGQFAVHFLIPFARGLPICDRHAYSLSSYYFLTRRSRIMSFKTSWLSGQIAVISLTSTAWRLANLMLTGMIFSALLLFLTRRSRTMSFMLSWLSCQIAVHLSDTHSVGACSSNVDRHDFLCIIFIYDATLAYFVITSTLP